ncbi:MAG: 23S rRNA (uracil(1939)-C(5))-methyltransferase RlmD [Bacilli bacterium]|nr:23S rRNA (uracil(1939)-C(5))-methyltransferase RlmD [Bacilli bacterium]MDD2681469.1 23S rRNA (uracil(1939)-C(5))-methyltransferase RlmD [Bacilli bacterium]MDD3121266.1 23S rRNA (uracil(1939)-C(5))-methyltransferase RlmD [Bacilli bacterium]
MENILVVDQLILLTIKKMGINGEGIGYYKRLAVFVDNAMPDEVVEVKITKVFNKYAYGIVNKYKVYSKERIKPECPYYGKCGGCSISHMSYQEQLRQKNSVVLGAFERYFNGKKLNDKIFLPIIGSMNEFHYRNKSSLPVRHDGNKAVVGMYAANTNMLVYTDECLIENKIVSDTIKGVLDIITKANIDIYNPKFRQGSLKYLVVRGFMNTLEAQVTYVLNNRDDKVIQTLNKVLELPYVKSVNFTINNDPKAIEIITNEVVHYKGNEKIHGKLGHLDFYISPTAFFQLNMDQTVVLYDKIKEIGKFNKKETMVDTYCGIGSIGLYLANTFKEIRGVDINIEAIEDAREVAKINNIDNASFYVGDVLTRLHDFENERFIPDVLVIDPPRRGLDLNMINFLKKSKINKIVYVSCNPSTLVKNINHLQNNYSIRTIQPIDMFPQTSSVETIVLLVRK